MPDFEFEFNQQDKDLIVTQDTATFSGENYIRLTIYPSEAATQPVNLGDNNLAIFFSSLNETPFEINTSPFYAGLNEITTKTIGIGGSNDFKIYKNGDDIYIKPNEIFNNFELPQGDYRIQIDFLNQVSPPFDENNDPGEDPNPTSDSANHYQFIIKEISTSRKEVRLKLKDINITDESNIITDLTNEFNLGLDKYQFKHILNIGTGDHIPIMNYVFDRVTNGSSNQSLILKLYEQLTPNISNLSLVTIEREVITTQVDDIYYFSDVADVYFGDGLVPDLFESWINYDTQNIGFENYNTLSQSISTSELDGIISASEYNYPNLNIDYSEFENHTFFGSAEKKLINFKNKVETIQSTYSQISASLASTASNMTGDPTDLVLHRQNLFDKVQTEINSFTPYERFLYFDGQNTTTASAPGVGKNYADVNAVSNNDLLTEINNGDGFKTVYHISNRHNGFSQFTDLFTEKYRVEDKPFFNYSGSIYLSFLLKGHSGSALTWENRNHLEHDGVKFPKDGFFQNRILDPTMTSSAYQRYIFHASQSYFIPKTTGNDVQAITDFGTNSTQIEIISGSVKTGSSQIQDSTGRYLPYLTNQSASAGIPFFGSVMPGGELFRVYYKTDLSASLLGHYNYENVTIDDNDFDVLDVSGQGNNLRFGGAGTSYTSASIITGVDGKENSAIEWSGSLAGASGNMFLLSQPDGGVTDINNNLHTLSSSFTGFTMATWFKTEDSSSNIIMSIDIKSSGSIVKTTQTSSNGALGTHDEADGWWLGHTNNRILGEVTDAGFPILNNANFRSAATLDVDDGEWHHVALSYNKTTGTGSLYYDGANVKTLSGILMTGSNAMDSLGISAGPGGAIGYGDGAWDESRFYNKPLSHDEITQLYLTPDAITDVKLTDVKITLENPTDVLPFDNLYHTSSANWTNWYNGMVDSAASFDTDNIHSFENNLPLYIQDSSDYKDMKDFLSLQGEQYDLIRNHIDSIGTLHDRGYKENNSAPKNSLPVLLDNMGWEAINPFSGSLSDSLGGYLTNVTSIDDIKNNTWRKTLNNLIYIYKSKGTQNSSRGLMNVYGYPPDVLSFKEFGGSTGQIIQNSPGFIKDSPPSTGIDTDFSLVTGSIQFKTKKQRLHRHIFGANPNNTLRLDWWMDSANINSFEFVYKHSKTTNTQTLVESSGSDAEKLWDLRLVPSSDGASSSFEFRLNNSPVADTALATRGFSMSLDYNPIKNGELWNVMVQRMTGSTAGPGTIEYRLHAGLSEDTKIKTYSYVTMSISGGLSGGSTDGGKGFYANQNFQSSGSRHYLSSSNLIIGSTVTGSMSEIKAYDSAISISRFRQHVLNKFSIVGNSVTSDKNNLIYHFKLNENYSSSSISASAQQVRIVDSAPKTNFITDYSFNRSGDLYTSSLVAGVDIIDTTTLGLEDNSQQENDGTIVIRPDRKLVGNLSPTNSAAKSLIQSDGEKPKYKTSKRLELFKSPQDFINTHILNTVDGFNFEKYYGNPAYYYSSSYTDLVDFKKQFIENQPIKIDTNKFIRSHEDILNSSIVEGLRGIVPARSTFSDKKSNFGVEIKPTILEKQKYRNIKQSVEANPNTATGSYIVDIKLSDSLFGKELLSIHNSVKEGTSLSQTTASGTFEQPKTGSITTTPSTTDSVVQLPKSGSIIASPSTTGSTLDFPKSGSNNYFVTHYNKSFVNIHNSWGTGTEDTHFINFAGGKSSVTSDYNIGHIDTRNHFYILGDTEIYSGSKYYVDLTISSSGGLSDFGNSSRFHNRLILDTDIHSGVTYESFVNGNPGAQTGRMVGKTRYFFTGSSDGNLILPRNHVSMYSYPFKERMIEGTQNTDPGFLNVRYEDYATSSFYRVKVTGGENQIIVKSGDTGLDDQDRIIY